MKLMMTRLFLELLVFVFGSTSGGERFKFTVMYGDNRAREIPVEF